MLEFFHILGFPVCHQFAERSFFACGIQFPVCSRCTGLLVAFAIALIFCVILFGKKKAGIQQKEVLFVLALSLLPLAFDGVTSYLHIRETTNAVRFATGFLVGFAAGLALYPVMLQLIFKDANDVPILNTARERIIAIATCILACPFMYLICVETGIFGLLISTICLLISWVSVITAFLCLIPKFQAKAKSVSDAVPFFVSGFGICIFLWGILFAFKLIIYSLIA